MSARKVEIVRNVAVRLVSMTSRQCSEVSAPVGIRAPEPPAKAARMSTRSELLMDVVVELLEVVRDGAVGDQADGPTSVRLDGLDDDVERGSVATDDRDGGAAGGQGSGGGRSDAARATGHYGGLVGEIGVARWC
jgi:hypothetical protein